MQFKIRKNYNASQRFLMCMIFKVKMFKMKRDRVYTPFHFSDGLNSGFSNFVSRTCQMTKKQTNKKKQQQKPQAHLYLYLCNMASMSCAAEFSVLWRVCVCVLISFGEVNVSKKICESYWLNVIYKIYILYSSSFSNSLRM